MALTDTAIRSAKPKEKIFKLFDAGAFILRLIRLGANGGVGSTDLGARKSGSLLASIPMWR